MLRFIEKRRKKFLSKLGIPEDSTNRNANTGADCDEDSDDINHRGDSQIVNRDRITGDQQPPASDTPTFTPGPDGGDPILHGPGHTRGGPTRTRSEQLCHSTRDLRSDRGDPSIHTQEEHENQGSGAQQPSETVLEHTSSSDQDGGDAHDLIRSEKSRVVKERGWIDRTLGRTIAVVNLAKGPAEAFGPLKAVLQSISDFYSQYQNTVDVKDKVETLCSRIATLLELFEKPASDEKEKKRREGLSNKLKGIEEKSRPFREKFGLLKFLDNAEDGKDVNGLLDDLQEALRDYMMVQQMAIYDQGCKLMDAAEKSVLNNFRCAKGAEFRHGERKGCLRGTRGPVLDTIELWAREPTRSRIYWLNGLAGTGKSTIAKTIAERLFADGQLGASFFCSRDFEDRRNLHFIFPTLATQLARKYPEFRSTLLPLIESDPGIADESLHNQMDKLIVQSLNQTSISTVIIIDALDECEDEEPASAILSVIGQLVSEIPNVKFFLTGRPDPHISNGFRPLLLAKMTDVFVLHNVKPDQVDGDIRLFFTDSFSELARYRSGLDDWPTREKLDRLCRRAAGLFVYAAATVKFVSDKKRDPESQLDLLLKSQKIGASEGRTLDALYTAILQEAFGGGGPKDDAQLRSVLGAVVLATNPLSPSAIATILGFNARDVSPLLSSVNSLLILHEDPSCPVRPFHKSFPDFVTDPDRCTNERFLIPPSHHHLQLLDGCLGLMNRTLAKNMCDLPDGVANSDVGDLKERTEKYIDPALRYACLSWHVHLVDADTTPGQGPAITTTLHQFLEKSFLFWLEVLSVLGALRHAVDALEAVAEWSEESSTLDLANDCFRFVTGYFEVISASAQHIYHSALVYVPQESMARKLYESYAHPFTRVVHGLPMSWDVNTAATTRHSVIKVATWSPCNRFIAIAFHGDKRIEILDSVTLQRLQTLEVREAEDTSWQSVALVFSPDSHILTCWVSRPQLFINWDLQTGGLASVTRLEEVSFKDASVTYSPNGKFVVVLPFYRNTVIILDAISGVRIHSHTFTTTIHLGNGIWTHGESLRFTTVDVTTIIIWEVGFTSDAVPTKVETLPFLGNAGFLTRYPEWDEGSYYKYIQFLPSPCRLAVLFDETVAVWDVRKSQFLLYCQDAAFYQRTSFSSDGRFFACSTWKSEVYLWKESPTGYILHQILASGAATSSPLLSRNGELIFALSGSTIRLWRTKDSTTPPPSVLTQTPPHTRNFVVDFSPDGMFAAVARQRNNAVDVLNLKSGVPQLTIDAGMEIYGLKGIGNTVTVVGEGKVVTWDLPTGDHTPNAIATLKDSARTIDFRSNSWTVLLCASMSPDSCYIATIEDHETGPYLELYDGSTGEWLGEKMVESAAPWFAPGGREIWLARDDGEQVFRVDDLGRRLEDVTRKVDIEDPPEGYPWASSRGYRVTYDWWILDPSGKRLLMLPPLWQSFAKLERVWNGQFLALVQGGPTKPVILELL